MPINLLELDMLNLGDADSILVSQWTDAGGYCVLVDGGSGIDATTVREFLRRKNIQILHAVVCTHPHNDHARGLVKLLADDSLRVDAGWMHDIRKHVNPITLRREMAGKSAKADWVKQVVENTEDLSRAFALRNITPQEPFAGSIISYLPILTVLGPDQSFYQRSLDEFLGLEVPAAPTSSPYARVAASYLGGLGLPPPPSLTTLTFPLPTSAPDLSSIYLSALATSSVSKDPQTQPFNNTSAILGGIFSGHRFLLTGDAGAQALDRISPDWRNVSWMQVPHHGSDGNLSKSNIARFCPKLAYISAKGDANHPSRAVANGLITAGAQVASTHKNGNLWFGIGFEALPHGYGPLTIFKGTATRSAGVGRL
jgi:beta-lactamase superfamily II metal-dependent hydrolase